MAEDTRFRAGLARFLTRDCQLPGIQLQTKFLIAHSRRLDNDYDCIIGLVDVYGRADEARTVLRLLDAAEPKLRPEALDAHRELIELLCNFHPAGDEDLGLVDHVKLLAHPARLLDVNVS